MTKYRCGMRGDPKVLAHDYDYHASYDDWRKCDYPEYRGMDSPISDIGRSSGRPKSSTLTKVRREDEGKLYLGAPSNYDVSVVEDEREEIATERKALASAETEEQKVERKEAEKKARHEAKQVERESYVRNLKAQRAPLQVEVEGLKADQRMGRNGWVGIIPALIISVGLLGVGGVLSIISLLTGLAVVCFIVGGLGLLASGAFSIYWFERFYGSNYASEIKKREVKIEQIEKEMSSYHDIVPDVFS